jgi:phage repressor protein C with HTH and peptisase S24 domain
MTKDIYEIRRLNLLRQLEKSGVIKSEFARKIGISRAYLSQLITQGFRFGERSARGIEEALRLQQGTLDLVDADKLAPVEVWDSPSDLQEGVFAIVPRVAVSLAAGTGTLVEEEMDLPPLAFREDWLKKKNVTSRTNLRIAEVKGDSMEGYLFDGDIVLIDMGQKQVVDREVYAIRYGDEVRIKRLSKRFDKGLIISSDNKAYADESIAANDAQHIEVLGRMLWRGG